MKKILDEIIPRQVRLERVKAGQNRRMLRLLQKMEKSIYAEIMTRGIYDPKRRSYQERRLKALLLSINRIINEFTTGARALNRRELKKLAELENQFIAKTINDSIGIDIVSPTITGPQIAAIVSDTLIEGAPTAEWWSRQNKKLKERFADRVRTGFIRNLTTEQIVRTIRGTRRNGFRDGIMKGTRAQVAALVRSSVQTVANEVRIKTYQNNDLIEAIQWSATFDQRTTDICIALDGQRWTTDLEPIGSAPVFPGPTAHIGCRSTQVPVLVKFKSLAKKNKRLAARLDKELSKSTKASMDGQVDSGLTYPQWLKIKEGAEPGFARSVLGARKYELWKSGKLNLRRLIDENARPLAVEDL